LLAILIKTVSAGKKSEIHAMFQLSKYYDTFTEKHSIGLIKARFCLTLLNCRRPATLTLITTYLIMTTHLLSPPTQKCAV